MAVNAHLDCININSCCCINQSIHCKYKQMQLLNNDHNKMHILIQWASDHHMIYSCITNITFLTIGQWTGSSITYDTCGSRFSRSANRRYPCTHYAELLEVAFGVQIDNGHMDVHPQSFRINYFSASILRHK